LLALSACAPLVSGVWGVSVAVAAPLFSKLTAEMTELRRQITLR
jgi:hypothetical protein